MQRQCRISPGSAAFAADDINGANFWFGTLADFASLSYWVTMNILVACDSFKDALPADGVCRAIAAGLARSHPGAIITQMPLSDGGEGLLDVLRGPLGLTWIERQAA